MAEHGWRTPLKAVTAESEFQPSWRRRNDVWLGSQESDADSILLLTGMFDTQSAPLPQIVYDFRSSQALRAHLCDMYNIEVPISVFNPPNARQGDLGYEIFTAPSPVIVGPPAVLRTGDLGRMGRDLRKTIQHHLRAIETGEMEQWQLSRALPSATDNSLFYLHRSSLEAMYQFRHQNPLQGTVSISQTPPDDFFRTLLFDRLAMMMLLTTGKNPLSVFDASYSSDVMFEGYQSELQEFHTELSIEESEARVVLAAFPEAFNEMDENFHIVDLNRAPERRELLDFYLATRPENYLRSTTSD